MGYDFFARHDNGQSSCPASILIGRERDSRPQLFPSRKILKSSPSLGNCARDYPSTPPPEIRFPPEKRVVNQKERKNVEKNSVAHCGLGRKIYFLPKPAMFLFTAYGWFIFSSHSCSNECNVALTFRG